MRVIDALAIYKDEAGEVAVLQFSDLSTDESTDLGAIIANTRGTPIVDTWVHPLDLIAVGLMAGEEEEEVTAATD